MVSQIYIQVPGDNGLSIQGRIRVCIIRGPSMAIEEASHMYYYMCASGLCHPRGPSMAIEEASHVYHYMCTSGLCQPRGPSMAIEEG
jgi:spore coat protein CotF